MEEKNESKEKDQGKMTAITRKDKIIMWCILIAVVGCFVGSLAVLLCLSEINAYGWIIAWLLSGAVVFGGIFVLMAPWRWSKDEHPDRPDWTTIALLVIYCLICGPCIWLFLLVMLIIWVCKRNNLSDRSDS